ncbi:MAG: hypothetical protein MAGBODY4_00560 [Candidatus Marinimicrobia bacterium]|nr:hypothetical protein [Candidatus Neomarinimicrobiota bacterium]
MFDIAVGYRDDIFASLAIFKINDQVNRHGHKIFSLEPNFDLIITGIQTFIPHLPNTIVDRGSPVNPFVKVPGKIITGDLFHDRYEIIRIRMFEFPLLHISLHHFAENRIPEHIFQVVKHFGSLEINLAVLPVFIEFIGVRRQRTYQVAGMRHLQILQIVPVIFPCIIRIKFTLVPVTGGIPIGCSTDDLVHRVGCGEIGKSLVHHCPICLIGAYHTIKPIMRHFVGK